MQTNKNYDNLEQSYLFSTIARKVREYSEAHPEADIIRLGIGDVTRPLVPAVIDALHAAVEDQAKQETFHGYGDEQGYGFLHEALVGSVLCRCFLRQIFPLLSLDFPYQNKIFCCLKFPFRNFAKLIHIHSNLP